MKDMTYEKAINRIEEITALLEHDAVTLDDSVKLFEEGVKLADYCGKCLEQAEQKVTELTKNDSE